MTWDWEGQLECPECKEVFYYQREDGFPEKWNLQLWHDHEGEAPVWKAAAYKTWKGRRKPPEVKTYQSGIVSQKRLSRAARR